MYANVIYGSEVVYIKTLSACLLRVDCFTCYIHLQRKYISQSLSLRYKKISPKENQTSLALYTYKLSVLSNIKQVLDFASKNKLQNLWLRFKIKIN